MKHIAVIALAGAVWLINRRQRKPSSADVKLPPPPLVARYPPAPSSHPVSNGNKNVSPIQAAPEAPSASKPILGALFQWLFLILLGSALSLAAVKGAWDVFAILVVAASMQLGGQVAKWLGGSGAGGSGNGRRVTGRGPRGARGTGVDAAAALALRPPPRAAVADPRLGGVWVKDGSRSDPMDEAVTVMRLNGLVRTAIKLIRGLEIDPAGLRAGRFDMAIFSVISWFKVRESYLLDGTVGFFNRRDLRRGKHAASVAVQPDGSLVVSVSWGEPLGGFGTDHFALIPAAAVAAAAAASSSASGATGPAVTALMEAAAAAAAAGSVTEPAAAAADDDDLLVVTSTIRLGGPGAQTGGLEESQAPETLAAAAAAAPPSPVVYRTVYVRGGRGRRHHPGGHHEDQGHQHQHQQ